jgi:2-(1,2-epoxy-1,2-dihydrophenyl)acetyl-CoA isomerase
MGEPIDAERALAIGLVTRLVPPDQLLTEVRKMAAHLATFAPFVPRTMKAMAATVIVSTNLALQAPVAPRWPLR